MLKSILSVAGAGVLAGTIALGATTMAGAQGGTEAPPPPVDDTEQLDQPELSEEAPELSEEAEEAIWDAFDQCLVDAGVPLEDPELETDEELELTPEQEEAIDAAFDQCEPILDELPDEAFSDEKEEEVWAAFDQCLTDQGLDPDAVWELEDTVEKEEDLPADVLAGFEACDPILEEAFAEEFCDDADHDDEPAEGDDDEPEGDDGDEPDDDGEPGDDA